jgi:VanZ family protein
VHAAIVTICFAGLYGASDEVHQHFNPPRDAEVLDVMADVIGAAIGAIALYAWGIIRGRDGL